MDRRTTLPFFVIRIRFETLLFMTEVLYRKFGYFSSAASFLSKFHPPHFFFMICICTPRPPNFGDDSTFISVVIIFMNSSSF